MSEWRSDPTCQEMVELVTEYLEGAMPPEWVDLFELHLMACEGCEIYLNQIRQSIALTAGVREDEVDPTELDRLLVVFRSRRG